MDILRDERIRSIEWRDLTRLNKLEIVTELLLSLPWLIGSLVFAHFDIYPIALPLSFMFFLTGLRQVHNAFHYVLGISRPLTEWLLLLLSILMLGSMHAIQINHLRHHSHCMDEEDIEAMSARLTALRAILMGPLFPLLLHKKALEVAKPRQLRWIYSELLANIVWIYVVFWVFDIGFLKYHVIAMCIGQCLASFFAVWTVHHDCDRSHFIARTIRNHIKSLITFDMFYHIEHHLFPAVPTCHLPKLAVRLDKVAPELKEKRVF